MKEALFYLVVLAANIIQGITGFAGTILAMPFSVRLVGMDVAVHLLPYHRLGESKNDSLGKEMNMGIEVPSDEHMQGLKSIVESFGLKSQIGG